MENIDKILKESFDGFAPEAPNVWSSVSQQVGNQAVHQSVAGKVATAFKSATIITKVIIVAALPVLSGVGYALYQSSKPAETKIETTISNQATDKAENEMVVSEEPKSSASAPIIVIPKKFNNPTSQTRNVERTSEASISQTQIQNESSNNSVIDNPTNNVQVTASNKPKSEANNQTKPRILDRSERSQNTTKEIVTINEENDNLIIPDVFTPGDIDGKNDFFKILIDNEKSYYLKIFDFNDNLVFESNSKENTWDGRNYKNGQTCEEGTYSFIFIYELNSGKSATKSGKIKLIR